MITAYTAKYFTEKSKTKVVKKALRKIYRKIKKAARQGYVTTSFELVDLSDKVVEEILKTLVDKGYDMIKYKYNGDFSPVFRYVISWNRYLVLMFYAVGAVSKNFSKNSINFCCCRSVRIKFSKNSRIIFQKIPKSKFEV